MAELKVEMLDGKCYNPHKGVAAYKNAPWVSVGQSYL